MVATQDMIDGVLVDKTPEEIAQAEASAEAAAASVKVQRWDEIKAERDRRKAGGFKVVVNGVTYWFHSDAGSKVQHIGNKDTARDQLAAGGVMTDALLDPETGTPIVWKALTAAGEPEVWLPLTCQLAFDIVKAGKAAELAHHRSAEQQKAAMETSSNPATYDFMQDAAKTRWPIIFGE